MPRSGPLGRSPSHKHRADKLRREARSPRAGRRTLKEAAEKVGVGVSQPRRRRREKEVGELRRIIPSCQLSVSPSRREGGSQLGCGPELTVGNQVMENDGCRVAEKSGPSPPAFSALQRDKLRPRSGTTRPWERPQVAQFSSQNSLLSPPHSADLRRTSTSTPPLEVWFRTLALPPTSSVTLRGLLV